MPKPEPAATPVPDHPVGAFPQAAREGSSRWNALEMGFFTAGDAPPPPQADELEEGDEVADVDNTDQVFRLRRLSIVWQKMALPWRRLGLDWRAMAVVFGPGALIGAVLLLAGGSPSHGRPVTLPAATVTRVQPAPPLTPVAPPAPLPVAEAPAPPEQPDAPKVALPTPRAPRPPRAAALVKDKRSAPPVATKSVKLAAAPKKTARFQPSVKAPPPQVGRPPLRGRARLTTRP